jgi:hypothetical protein
MDLRLEADIPDAVEQLDGLTSGNIWERVDTRFKATHKVKKE